MPVPRDASTSLVPATGYFLKFAHPIAKLPMIASDWFFSLTELSLQNLAQINRNSCHTNTLQLSLLQALVPCLVRSDNGHRDWHGVCSPMGWGMVMVAYPDHRFLSS